MLSAEHDPELIFKASKLGADDYLSKPFEPKELDLRINKILEKQRVSDRGSAASRPGAPQQRFRRTLRNQPPDGRGEAHDRAGG